MRTCLYVVLLSRYNVGLTTQKNIAFLEQNFCEIMIWQPLNMYVLTLIFRTFIIAQKKKILFAFRKQS